jgi:hypothetical protein
MKKLLIGFGILFFSIFNVAFGAVHYTRTPAGLNITSPVNIQVSVDSWSELIEGAGAPNTYQGWFVYATTADGNNVYTTTNVYPSSTLSINENISIPTGINIVYITITVCPLPSFSSCEGYGDDYSPAIEGNIDNPETIFTIIEAPQSTTPTITYPSSTASLLLAKLSDTIKDNGLLLIIVVAAAIPLVFYLAEMLIDLIPKDKVMKEAEAESERFERIMKDID